ncbi:MAG: DoxX family membrane protein [bacterium]
MPKNTPFDHFSRASKTSGFTAAAFILRLFIGLEFFISGWTKIFDPEGWSAVSYLAGATGPFVELFQSMAGSVFVDYLNMYGLLLIGLALILGAFVRPASFFGFVLMVLYYFAQFEQNTINGLIDRHVIHALIFILFFFGAFGHVWGLDALFERQPRLQGRKKAWLTWFFG